MDTGIHKEQDSLTLAQRFNRLRRIVKASRLARHWKDGAIFTLTIAVLILGFMDSPLSEAIKWDLVIALGTVTAGLVALRESYKAGRRAEREHMRFSEAQKVALIMSLEDRFNGPYMIRVRATAADNLLRGNFQCVSDVIDFFETVSLLSSKGLLDKQMLWSVFYDWVLNYMTAAKDFIDETRKEDRTIWSDAVDLLKEMEKVQIQHALVPGPRAPEVQRDFLKAEIELRNVDGSPPVNTGRRQRDWRERAAEARLLKVRSLK